MPGGGVEMSTEIAPPPFDYILFIVFLSYWFISRSQSISTVAIYKLKIVERVPPLENGLKGNHGSSCSLLELLKDWETGLWASDLMSVCKYACLCVSMRI